MARVDIGAIMVHHRPAGGFGITDVGTATQDQKVDMSGIHHPDQRDQAPAQVPVQGHFRQETTPGAQKAEGADLPEAEVPEDLLLVVVLLAEAVPLEAAHLDAVLLVEVNLLVEENLLEAEVVEAVSPEAEVPEDVNKVRCIHDQWGVGNRFQSGIIILFKF